MQNNRPCVCVLMSTYNGEKYIEEQIDSIFCQNDVEVTLVIRDDESTDDTINIIKSIKKKHNSYHIVLHCGKNIGVHKSFKKLVLKAPEYDYYAFADQDDIWYPDKLHIAVSSIENIEGVALYASNQMCVDGDGNDLFLRFDKGSNPQSLLVQSLLDNRLSGCTMLFNADLMKHLQKIYSVYNKPMMHDSICSILAQSIGELIYDPEPRMSFRRHGNNVTSEKTYSESSIKGKIDIYKHKARTFVKYLNNSRAVSTLASKILTSFESEISNDAADVLKYFSNYYKNSRTWMKASFNNKYYDYFPEPKWTTQMKFVLRVM